MAVAVAVAVVWNYQIFIMAHFHFISGMKDLGEVINGRLSEDTSLTISNQQNEGVKPEPTQVMIGEIIQNINNPASEILGQMGLDGTLRLRKLDILIEKELA